MALYLSTRHCHFTGTEEHFPPLRSLLWLSTNSSFAVLLQKTEREMRQFYVSCLLKSAWVYLLCGIPCYWSRFSSYILHSQVKCSTNSPCILSSICLHCFIFCVLWHQSGPFISVSISFFVKWECNYKLLHNCCSKTMKASECNAWY